MSVAALILAAQALKNRNTADTEAYKALIDQIATLADRPGRDGRDGRDGASIDRAVVRDGRLVLTRSTGDDIDVGPVTGSKGDRGEPGPKGESIVGPAGPAGRDGRDGEDGVGIADVARVKDSIVLTLDDGRTVDLGSFRGPAGPSGPRGPAGTGGTGGGAAITVQDEGSTLTTEATSLNFTGSGVTATNSGSSVTIDVPGSSGSGLQLIGSATLTTQSSTTDVIPYDGTTPLWNEGSLLIEATATPSSASSTLVVVFNSPLVSGTPAGGGGMISLFRDGTGTSAAETAVIVYQNATMWMAPASMWFFESAGSTASTTFSVRYGSSGGGTVFVNRLQQDALAPTTTTTLLIFEAPP
jgi:hypothetical protein